MSQWKLIKPLVKQKERDDLNQKIAVKRACLKEEWKKLSPEEKDKKKKEIEEINKETREKRGKIEKEEQDLRNCYKRLWDPSRPLGQNQKALAEKFVDQCCDCSFKKGEQLSENLCFGKLDSSKKILFSKKAPDKWGELELKDLNTNFSSEEHLLVEGALPVSSMNEYKVQFLKYFEEIASDPVGCELFRILIAKSVVNKLPKLKFVPISVNDTHLLSKLGSALNYPAYNLRNDEESFTNLIFFVPEWLNREEEGIYAVKYDKKSRSFVRKKCNFPFDVTLFHEILHHFHSDKEQKTETREVILRRFTDRVRSFCYEKNIGSDGCEHYLNAVSNLYSDDEEIHTVFGLTEGGLDLLNESSYSSHKYGLIRSAHANPELESEIIDELKNVGFINSVLVDEDLCEYYLSPNSSIKYPKFGIGDYECKDLDPKTGKKLSFAQ